MKNKTLGVVAVIILAAGGWRYLTQPNTASTSETQQATNTETQPVVNNQQSQSASNPSTTDNTAPRASLTSSSMTSSSGVFNVTGTAANLKNGIGVYLVPSTYSGNRDEASVRQFLTTQNLYNINASASSAINNGTWSVSFGTFVSGENGQTVTKPLAAGTYTVLIYNAYDSDPTKSDLLLTTGTLKVGQ